MKPFRKRLAALLCAALCICATCAMAGETDEDDWEARYERLLRFATEKHASWWYEDYEEEPELEPFSAYLNAERYKGKNASVSYDFSKVESLSLSDFNQAQFESILMRTPNLHRLTLFDCAVEDYSPLLQIAPQLTLSLSWQPGLLEQLTVLPNLYGLELDAIPDADLPPLSALTGLEKLVLWFDSDSTVDLHPLGALTGLEKLVLWFDSDSTVDLHPLGALPELCSLTLYCRGAPADTLPDMPALEELHLSCEIDLAQLTHTPALERLYIGYYMSDDLTPLQTLHALSYLEINAVHGIDVTDYLEQLEALHEAMPDLKIVFYYCC